MPDRSGLDTLNCRPAAIVREEDVVADMTRVEAIASVRRMRGHFTALRAELDDFVRRGGHVALGYETLRAAVAAGLFGMSWPTLMRHLAGASVEREVGVEVGTVDQAALRALCSVPEDDRKDVYCSARALAKKEGLDGPLRRHVVGVAEQLGIRLGPEPAECLIGEDDPPHPTNGHVAPPPSPAATPPTRAFADPDAARRAPADRPPREPRPSGKGDDRSQVETDGDEQVGDDERVGGDPAGNVVEVPDEDWVAGPFCNQAVRDSLRHNAAKLAVHDAEAIKWRHAEKALGSLRHEVGSERVPGRGMGPWSNMAARLARKPVDWRVCPACHGRCTCPPSAACGGAGWVVS